ncbi:MAG: aminotransferase class III-fold pyridoxal phosphate-dependent enzyme [Candidatus Hodarchaeales archaeon]
MIIETGEVDTHKKSSNISVLEEWLLSRIDYSRPNFSLKDGMRIIEDLYGMTGTIKEIPSYEDRNFYFKSKNGEKYVLKISASSEKREILEFQNKAMIHLSSKINCPTVISTKDKEEITISLDEDGQKHYTRLITYLSGEVLGEIKNPSTDLFYDIGRFMGSLTQSLSDFHHPAAQRDFNWDLKNASSVIRQHMKYLDDPEKLSIIEYFLNLFDRSVQPYLHNLKMSIIHSDANSYNLVIDSTRLGKERIAIIDFGDTIYSYTIFDLAINIAYAILGNKEPILCASTIIRGYNTIIPLSMFELDILFILINMRLVVSVSIGAFQQIQEPDNEYLKINEAPAWEMLFKLRKIHPSYPTYVFKHSCNISPYKNSSLKQFITRSQIKEKRLKNFGGNLSISYKKPLNIVRGYMQYLYDENDRTYLDLRNNVPHVGHSHPKVVWALHEQATKLNTNTRYLNENQVRYAERLSAKLPSELNVFYFVNSGSEANELALRLARTYTNRNDIITIEGAYHGNTGELINISPYKFNGVGGKGPPDYVHTVSIPDTFRGKYRMEDSNPGEKYSEEVRDIIGEMQKNGLKPAAFVFESIMGSAGQFIYPKGYLRKIFKYLHDCNGVCIADEVQVGFGRVGTHFWGFEIYNVVPDIVTMGKPIGNGHPLGAVVTTKEIAESFNNGMEFFSSTGGNTVSCAVGIAVLDVIEEEKLQKNALRVGSYIIEKLRKIKRKYQIIGEVRGSGLFLGIDLIKNTESLQPAIKEAENIVEELKNHGILIGNDKNVLKIKPPMVFTEENAEYFIKTFEKILQERE